MSCRSLSATICRTHRATEADLEALRANVLNRLLARQPVTSAIVAQEVFDASDWLGASADHEAEVYEAMIEHFALGAE